MTDLTDRLSRHADLHEHQPWADDEQMQYARDLREAVGLIAELARLRAVEPVALPGSRTQSVYLAGPMTGYADFNFPAFNAAANGLRAEGLRVVNPADHGLVEGATWADYLRHDIAKIAGCESIALLPGWSKSKGAQLEVHIARALEMPIRMLEGAEAAPPAQPAEQQAQTVCKRTLIEIDARLRECSIVGASAADAYDTFYQHMVETALAAQPAEPIEARSRYETAYAGRQLPHTQTTTSEPVQRLSDERAAFEAWHNEYRTQELVRRDDTYYNTHVRCRWEGWQARAIESALQPGWRDIESAPKDGTRIILGSSDGAWMAEYQPVYQSGYRPDNPWFSVMLNHAHMGRFPKAKPTHWQPIPPAPKATK